jgi:hypothetical protein
VNYFESHSLWRKICLAVLLLAGLGLRLINLTNPPLDIHPTRQLHSALMARGLYYQHVTDAPQWQIDTAIQQGKREPVIEPPIMETVTALFYGVSGGENVWFARILSSLFWVAAGLAFYSLTSAMTNPDGGMAALAVYLFLPYGVLASRTFQPDPLMVSLIVTAWWGFYRWQQKPTWKWSVIAGLLAGLAIFVKNVSVFFLAVPFLVVLLKDKPVVILRNKQNWVFGALAVIPVIAYTVYGTYIAKFLTQQFNFRFFPELWITPANYSRWFSMVIQTLGLPALLISLVGVFLIQGNINRRLVLGCWLGYIIYGYSFAYHIGTHDYYQLPFIPVAILSIAPVGAVLIEAWLKNFTWKHNQAVMGVLMALMVGAAFWSNRLTITSTDFRAEVTFWQQMGNRLRDTTVLGLTEDYGYRMEFYGWDNIENWSSSGDLALREMAGKPKDALAMLTQALEGKHYFLVTWMDDFNRQTEVKNYLYAHYPYEQGDRYILFDISQPRQ